MSASKSALLGAAGNFPRWYLLVITGVTAVTVMLFMILSGDNAQANRTEIQLNLVPVAPYPSTGAGGDELPTGVTAEQVGPVVAWQKTKVRSGDTLSDLFSRHNIGGAILHKLVKNTEHGQMLVDIRPGHDVMLGRIDGELQAVRYVRNKLESLEFIKTDDGFTSREIVRAPDIRHAYAAGTIKNSLFHAASEAGLADNMIMRLANIFAWDVDFVMDIREGDSFNLIYEEKYLDGKKIGNGDILAATFVTQGRKLEAVYYVDSRGKGNYFTPDGKSMRRLFIRTPVEFTRISSRFNPNRLHPVFKTRRPHRGVDYAAPTGTPITAAGAGIVQFSGWQRGYGNVVYIKHPNNIVTVYAHQSRTAGLRRGQRVKQGQTIGYVGQTGWATGPHLHYEFRVNGIHRNPLTVKLPDAAPLPKEERANFQSIARVMLAELETQTGTVLASADDASHVTTQ